MSSALTVTGGGAYYVNEQPSTPMTVTLTDAAGDPVSLVDTASVAFVGDELPAGDATIANPYGGLVQYAFSAPFADAGTLTLQVALTHENGGVDYSAPFAVVVSDPAEVAALLVTPAQVEDLTGVEVTTGDIARAQGMVSLACGRDLSNLGWVGGLSSADYYWLQLAVAYQAAEFSMTSGGLEVPFIPGATSIANGDVRVTFSEGAGAQVSGLNGLAMSAVSRLSWMGNFRSVQAKPFSQRGAQPSAWIPVSTDRGFPY